MRFIRAGLSVGLVLGILGMSLTAEAAASERPSRVGLVSIGSDPARPVAWQPFLEAMRELGYAEGRNLVVKSAFADGRAEEIPRLVAELVRSGVDVIVATGTRETLAARSATSTIPIVMSLVPDPVGQGLVSSLARPGGNVTGVTNLVPGLIQKYVELLHEAVPAASRVAVVASPPNPVPENRRELDAASKTVGLRLSIISVTGPEDFDDAMVRARRDKIGAILVTSDPVTFLHRKRLVDSALKHQLPGIYWTREYVEDGGLMTYSASRPELFRRAAVYVDKILKGARPGDLPIEQPTKLELVINMTTAKMLGLTIPPSLLLRADEIIQ